MPNFQGNQELILQPRDNNVNYTYRFTICSSDTANDGYLPYNTTISGVTVTAYDSSGNQVTDLIDNYSIDNNDIIVTMSYPSTSGEGRYKLRFVLTLDNGTVIEADFGRIRAVDL